MQPIESQLSLGKERNRPIKNKITTWFQKSKKMKQTKPFFLLLVSIYFLVSACQTQQTESVAQNKPNKEEAKPDPLRTDFAYLKRYSPYNKFIAARAKGENRVVFMGNSIVEGWVNADSTFFLENKFIGRGISGQTSPQMLLRFRQDVIDLQPKVVIINAGTNDIAENTGPYDADYTFGNIVSMAQLALANGITPVLSSVLPASDFPWRKDFGNPSVKILPLNKRIKAYAERHNLVYLDYNTALTNDIGGMNPDLAADGVHPTLKGYKIMEGLAKAAIEDALEGIYF